MQFSQFSRLLLMVAAVGNSHLKFFNSTLHFALFYCPSNPFFFLQKWQQRNFLLRSLLFFTTGCWEIVSFLPEQSGSCIIIIFIISRPTINLPPFCRFYSFMQPLVFPLFSKLRVISSALAYVFIIIIMSECSAIFDIINGNSVRVELRSSELRINVALLRETSESRI